MQNERNDLSFCIFQSAFSSKLVVRLNKTAVGRHIGGQLTRSGTSAGANYEEACGAESRADFIHKLQIVLKELRILLLVRFNQKGKSYSRYRSQTFSTLTRS